jgi:hypothetical protein
VGHQAAAVFNDFDVGGQINGGEHAIAVDRRATLDDATGHCEYAWRKAAHDSRSDR